MSLLSGYIAGGAIELVDAVVGEEGDKAAGDEVVTGEADWWLGQLSFEEVMTSAFRLVDLTTRLFMVLRRSRCDKDFMMVDDRSI